MRQIANGNLGRLISDSIGEIRMAIFAASEIPPSKAGAADKMRLVS
jgi:hypothetical protein